MTVKSFEQLIREHGRIEVTWHRVLVMRDIKFGVKSLADIPKGTLGWVGNDTFLPDNNDERGIGVNAQGCSFEVLKPYQFENVSYTPDIPEGEES
jgi:hypothetical protein